MGRYSRVFVSLLVYLVIFSVVPFVLLEFVKDVNLVLIFTVILAFIPIVVGMGKENILAQALEKREKVSPFFIICLALAPMATNIIGGVSEELIKYVLSLFGVSFYNTAAEMTKEIKELPSIWAIVYTCFMAPVFEELTFRNYLYREIEKPRPWLGICISGIMFAFMHTNFDQSISLIPTGIFFSYLALRYSLWVPVVAHILNNTIFFVSSLFDGTVYGDIVMNTIFYLGLVSSILVLVSFIKYYKKNRHIGKGEPVPYIRNPFFWLFFIYCIAMMFFNEFATKFI